MLLGETSNVMFLSSAASSKGQHEITIPAGLPQYCFDGLSPDALYTATVFVQTPNLEGPGVSTTERTRECWGSCEGGKLEESERPLHADEL